MLLVRDPLLKKYRMKETGWKKAFHASGNQIKVGIAILTSDKIYFLNMATRDKEGHYIMITGSIQEEYITTVNICGPNIGAPQWMSQMLNIKAEIEVTK